MSANQPTTVNCKDFTTITLDSLIAKLTELRKTTSGQTPVAILKIDEGLDIFSPIADANLSNGCIVIENI